MIIKSEILNTHLSHPKDQIVLAISRIYNRGLTTTSGGNISIIDENGDIWVTPSAVDKGSLLSSDVVCVRQDGIRLGKHKPSSEFPSIKLFTNPVRMLKQLFMRIRRLWCPLV